MKFSRSIIVASIVAVALVFVQGQVMAAKDTAPGQAKKQGLAASTDTHGKSGEDHGNSGSNSNSGGNGSGNSSNSSQGSSDTSTHGSQGQAMKLEKTTERMERKEEAKAIREAKLGAAHLKDLIEKLSSDSSTLDRSVGKVAKVRVSVASEGATLKRHALQGVITAVGDGVITVAHQIHRERVNQVFVSDATLIKMKDNPSATFADLAVGQRVAAVGYPTDGGLDATRIHVIPGLATGIFDKQPVGSGSGETLTVTPSITDTATPSPTFEPVVTETPTLTPTPTP